MLEALGRVLWAMRLGSCIWIVHVVYSVFVEKFIRARLFLCLHADRYRSASFLNPPETDSQREGLRLFFQVRVLMLGVPPEVARFLRAVPAVGGATGDSPDGGEIPARHRAPVAGSKPYKQDPRNRRLPNACCAAASSWPPIPHLQAARAAVVLHFRKI